MADNRDGSVPDGVRAEDPALSVGRDVRPEPLAFRSDAFAFDFSKPIPKRRTFAVTVPCCEPCSLALGYAHPCLSLSVTCGKPECPCVSAPGRRDCRAE